MSLKLMPADAGKSLGRTFLANMVGGLGWAVGVAIGFTIVMGIVIKLLQRAGGLPIIGETLQSIIQPALDSQQQNLFDTFPDGEYNLPQKP